MVSPRWIGLACAAVALLQDPADEPGLRDIDLPDFPAGAAYVLGRLSNVELIGVRRSEPVYVALLTRDGLELAYRREALAGLAALRDTSPLRQLVSSLADTPGAEADRVALLLAQAPKALAAERSSLVALALDGERDERVRRGALAAVALGDQEVDRTWALAADDAGLTRDLLGALQLVRDPELRGRFRPRVADLLGPRAPVELRRAALLASPHLAGHEAWTFGVLTELVTGEPGVDEETRDAAVRALAALPRTLLPRDGVPGLLAHLRQDLVARPPEERSTPEFRRGLRLARDLASLLPAAAGAELTGALKELGVPTLSVRAVPHILRYDRTHLVAQRGRPVELVFENPGVMSHNLVLVMPGSLEKVGAAADRLVGAAASADGRRYVPQLPEVLQATELVDPRSAASLTFVAPDVVGEYPYLCSVPGHWVQMNGVLHVVEDVEAWRAENRDLIERDLAPTRRFVRAWGRADLAGELGRRAADPGLAEGRGISLERGEALFAELCSVCHRAGGEGAQVGPDLAEVAGRLAPRELLEQVLDPAGRIEDPYVIWAVELDDGTRRFGRIVEQVEQVEQVVRLQEDPRSDEPPLELARSEIVTLVRTRNSTMPMGLVNTLTAEEILDLLAYLQRASRR